MSKLVPRFDSIVGGIPSPEGTARAARLTALDECTAIVRDQMMMPFTNRSAISALNVVADKIDALKQKGS